MHLIHKGDYIMYRGGFGKDAPKQVQVTHLTLTSMPREKYGVDVNKVSVNEVAENRVLFSLSDGHWAYSEQVDGWIDETNGTLVPVQGRRPILQLTSKEAADIKAALYEWKLHMGTIEDLDNNKDGLTKERYEAIMEKLGEYAESYTS